MNLIEYNYDNQIIEFDLSGEDVMINATEMGKVFGKKPYAFLRQEDTKRFIEELKSAFPAFRSVRATPLNAGNDDSSSENGSRSVANSEEMANYDHILRTEKGKNEDGGATWMHRLLALKFAAWLDPRFEIWVYKTIDTLLFENARQTNEELKEKAKYTDRIVELVEELQTNPVYQESAMLQYKVKQINTRINKNTSNQLSLFRGKKRQ